MSKKGLFLCFLLLITVIRTPIVYAGSNIKARIGNQFFDTLEEAIKAASSTDIINLTGNVTLSETLEINKNVNINLNNHTISATQRVFLIQGGSLNLSGTGKIMETQPNYGAITLKGSNDPNQKDYSTVSVGSGITLEGWSGIFIAHNNKTGYGIRVNIDGDINAVDDASGGPGAGIYVNGYVQNKDNSPIININKTANITSTGNGIYAAGYAIYNINGAYIEGVESGLGIKSGSFNITNSTIIGSGKDKTPTTGNNNGINPSGVAIQIESNSEYEGNIELNINSGTIKSKNSNVIYEYTVNNVSTKVKNINLNGGIYSSDANKNVFSLSESFKYTHPSFISGGTYSSDPTNYLKNGYTTFKNENSLYEVVISSSTMNILNRNTSNNESNYFDFILIFSIIIIIGTIVYLNRKKIFH